MNENEKATSINENDEYDPYIISLTDDDGKEYNFEVLDDIDIENDRYLALQPKYDDPQDLLSDDGELVILKETVEDGNPFYVEIEDDDEYNKVASIFTDRLQDMFEITEE